MLDKGIYIGKHKGMDLIWYGRYIFIGTYGKEYVTYYRVPDHTHQVFLSNTGHIYFLGYN